MPVPQFVDVYGLKGAEQAEVAASFKKYVGKPVDTVAIEKSIADLEGTGTYSIINYNLVDENGKPGLLIRPRTKDYAPPFPECGTDDLCRTTRTTFSSVPERGPRFWILPGPVRSCGWTAWWVRSRALTQSFTSRCGRGRDGSSLRTRM